MKKVLFLLFLACLTIGTKAADQFIKFNSSATAMQLAGKNHVADIVTDKNDYEGVLLAAENLQKDFLAVCGQKPQLKNNATEGCILVGSMQSALIKRIIASGKISKKELQGKREKYILSVVDNPVKGIKKALVIAGSDKRGTIYGIYELSRQIGVSPWYWWLDVPAKKHQELFVENGKYTDGEPAVAYRGIFINDEHPCFANWSNEKFGGQNHKCYEHVFELLLRLKANYLWPAMWGNAFYDDDPENGELANRMGIVMGTSHHEPMARAQQDWKRRKNHGEWNYTRNGEELRDFWRGGIERAKNWETMVTIGMRGDGDEEMEGTGNVKLMEKIIKDQRQIISDVTGKKAEKTPQMWALYKEVLDYYDKGMKVPDDVIIMLCDDNWGNVRRVPTTKDLKHPGGWGLYYHVDYVGAPRNTKWLNVTPTQNMYEQLSLAYNHGIQKLWILNVGDLKPMEYPIQFFLDMAWNPATANSDVVTTHTRPFCAEQFGEEYADKTAELLNKIGWLNGRVTPEMLDANTYNVETGEWQQVVGEYTALEADALRLYLQLPENLHDSYRQLILFPIQAMTNLYQMYEAVAMNHYLAKLSDPAANDWAKKAKEAFKRDSVLCAQYNHDIADGKWNHMMTQKHIGYRTWNDNFPKDRLPELMTVSESKDGGYIFDDNTAYISMEAAHYFASKNASKANWQELPFIGRTLSGMALSPYTEATDDASLTYKFRLNPVAKKADKFTIHIIVKSTLDYKNKGGMEYEVTLDNGEKQTINFNHNLNEKPENIYNIYYPTIARRVVESTITLPAGKDEWHTLTIHPKDPGIVFEKIVVDAGGYKPSYLFMRESAKKRK
jgi:hypothetical protein